MNNHTVRPKSWLPELAVFATITAASLLVTLPLIFNLGSSVLGGHGDNLYFLWELWWFKRALLDLHVSPFVDHELYFPVGLELARDEITPANTILGLPLTAGFGPAAAYNLLALGSFILSGYAAYRFVFEATHHRIAGLVSGVAFAIMPYRLAHLAGHLNLLPTQWLVLSLVFLERFFRSRRWVDAASAGIFFALNALAAWYYLFIGAIALTVFVAIHLLPWRAVIRDRRMWLGAGWFGLVNVLLIAPFAVPYIELRQQGDLTRSFSELDSWSANVTDFFQPNPFHPLWGAATRLAFPFQWSTSVERTLSLGWGLLVLAGIGFWSMRRNRTAQALAVMAMTSFIIALGPTLHWEGKRVEYNLSPSIVQAAEQSGITTAFETFVDPSLAASIRAGRGFVPLPEMLMSAFVPLTSAIRVIVRFGWITFLAVALLAGFGAAAIFRSRRLPGWTRWAILTVVTGMIVFELWGAIPLRDGDVTWSFTPVQGRAVDRWLAAQPSQSLVVEYPLVVGGSAYGMLYQMFNHQLMVLGGMPPSFKPPILNERLTQFRQFPSEQTLAALQKLEVRYVVATPSAFASPSDWQHFELGMTILGLAPIKEFDGVLVYELK